MIRDELVLELHRGYSWTLDPEDLPVESSVGPLWTFAEVVALLRRRRPLGGRHWIAFNTPDYDVDPDTLRAGRVTVFADAVTFVVHATGDPTCVEEED